MYVQNFIHRLRRVYNQCFAQADNESEFLIRFIRKNGPVYSDQSEQIIALSTTCFPRLVMLPTVTKRLLFNWLHVFLRLLSATRFPSLTISVTSVFTISSLLVWRYPFSTKKRNILIIKWFSVTKDYSLPEYFCFLFQFRSR